ncbi:hypothetical protein [Candidatus Sororendozoicomonas aggregata]|uniref:hypothetical protein n=1 Tax=Candidatus Sororendozoicomonas aggregata TaxID=3073239 RepID=UPI002ED6234C
MFKRRPFFPSVPVPSVSDRFESRRPLSFAFKSHLIQLINTTIKEAKPGTGMSGAMYVDLPRAEYYVGGKLVSDPESLKESIRKWEELTSTDEFAWVRRNIEGLSAFLNQELVRLIFDAWCMSGETWWFQGEEVQKLSLGSDHYKQSYSVGAGMNVEFAIFSSVINYVTNEHVFGVKDGSTFTLAMRLRLEEIQQASGGTLLQASFDPSGDLYNNRCFVRVIPSGEIW